MDAALVSACERQMKRTGVQPDTFFFNHRGGRGATGELSDALSQHEPVESKHDYWRDDAPQSMLIEEVEAIWSAIDERDDWQPLMDKVAALRRMGVAHGPAPTPP